MFGAHLKAPAAMVRLRLYDVLSLLPPATYEGSFNALLRELVAEFTLTDNPANTTTSRLRSLCHHDDSVILGSWLQETDHKAIEDQVGVLGIFVVMFVVIKWVFSFLMRGFCVAVYEGYFEKGGGGRCLVSVLIFVGKPSPLGFPL